MVIVSDDAASQAGLTELLAKAGYSDVVISTDPSEIAEPVRHGASRSRAA